MPGAAQFHGCPWGTLDNGRGGRGEHFAGCAVGADGAVPRITRAGCSRLGGSAVHWPPDAAHCGGTRPDRSSRLHQPHGAVRGSGCVAACHPCSPAPRPGRRRQLARRHGADDSLCPVRCCARPIGLVGARARARPASCSAQLSCQRRAQGPSGRAAVGCLARSAGGRAHRAWTLFGCVAPRQGDPARRLCAVGLQSPSGALRLLGAVYRSAAAPSGRQGPTLLQVRHARPSAPAVSGAHCCGQPAPCAQRQRRGPL